MPQFQNGYLESILAAFDTQGVGGGNRDAHMLAALVAACCLGAGACVPCPTGATGPTGAAGGVNGNFAELYALMPGDNAAPVAANSPISFPNVKVLTAGMTTVGGNTIVLNAAGLWRIDAQVSISEAAQIAVAVNGAADMTTVVGRATGVSQLVISTVISSPAPGTAVQIWAIGGAGYTITPLAGGAQPVSATFRAQRLS